MSLGQILQIIGILFTTTGSILALTKLWGGYFHKSKKFAELLIWAFNESKKAGDKLRERDIKDLEEVLKSDDFHPEYKEWRINFYKSQHKEDHKNEKRGAKRIQNLLFLDRYFLQIGVSLIITGAVIEPVKRLNNGTQNTQAV